MGGCPLGLAIASHSTSHGSFSSCEEDEVWLPGMGQALGDIKERLELCRDVEVLTQALRRSLLGGGWQRTGEELWPLIVDHDGVLTLELGWEMSLEDP